MIRKLTFAAALAASALTLPAMAQDMVITNATVATGDGSDPIRGGVVVIRDGRVTYAGDAGGAGSVVSDTAINVNGAWVTPGIFASLTDLGLWDVGAVSESNDLSADSSPFSAAIDYSTAINPEATQIEVSRAGGVTRATTIGDASSSIFAGQGAVIDLGADPQAVTRPRAFQLVELGERGARLAGGSRPAAHTLLRNALREAMRLSGDSSISGGASRPAARTTGDDLPLDPRLADNDTERGDDVLLTRFDAAALGPVVRGEQPLYVVAERAADIRSTLALRQDFPALRLVLVGASEGWMVADEIAAAGVPVIADALDDLPASFEQLAATQDNVGRMVDAGVRVAVGRYGGDHQPRYAPQYAGSLVGVGRLPNRVGLTWGEAFAAITSIPAEIAGMGGRYGVLAPGAAGDIVIWSGDPLELSSQPLRVFIDGVEQPLDNHQTRLRDRYREVDESQLPEAYDW